MNKLIKSLNIVVAASVIIFSLIMLVLSCEIYSDEYGTDISFNNNFLISLLVGIILLIYFIITIKDKNYKYYLLAYQLSSLIVGMYSIGIFLKALNKSIINNASFDFGNNQIYFYVGVIALLLFTIKLLEYFKLKNDKIEIWFYVFKMQIVFFLFLNMLEYHNKCKLLCGRFDKIFFMFIKV